MIAISLKTVKTEQDDENRYFDRSDFYDAILSDGTAVRAELRADDFRLEHETDVFHCIQSGQQVITDKVVSKEIAESILELIQEKLEKLGQKIGVL